jgi:hypothetical protein
MISFKNLLTDSNEQSAGFEYLPNSRTMGNISTKAGRYYLVPFALRTSLQIMPVVMSVNSEIGLKLEPIDRTIINTTIVLGPDNKIHSSVGIYLYGGYCTEDNETWSSVVTFGRCGFSSFAYAIDEVQADGLSMNPIVQYTAAQNNSTVLADANYMVGVSTLQNQSYTMKLGANWTMLSDCFDESVVPNMMTGSSVLGDSTPSWKQLAADGSDGPYLEKALIACELSHS